MVVPQELDDLELEILQGLNGLGCTSILGNPPFLGLAKMEKNNWKKHIAPAGKKIETKD